VDDPILQHRTNFEMVLLPRLQRFTEWVYELRHNDDARYTLLHAVVAMSSSSTTAITTTLNRMDNDDDTESNDDTKVGLRNRNTTTTTTTDTAWEIVLNELTWLKDNVDIAHSMNRSTA
jgi:hypothetical protein